MTVIACRKIFCNSYTALQTYSRGDYVLGWGIPSGGIMSGSRYNTA